MTDPSQIIGAILAIAGSALVVSRRQTLRYVAFMMWTTSNVILMAVYLDLRAWPLFIMSVVFLCTSAAGAINNRPSRHHDP